jgi:hypothetical protein
MKLHDEELTLARSFARTRHFEELTAPQLTAIREKGRRLYRWFRGHQPLHVCINLLVIAFLLLADALVLLRGPALFLGNAGASRAMMFVVSGILVGGVHSYLMYSLVVFSLHEGAAHKLIFPPRGRVTALLNFVANNLCRLGSADPRWYARNHISHHSKFGTEEDGEFLNFVLRRRYWLTFMPFAMFFNYSDFVVHRKTSYTVSEGISVAVAIAYNLAYGRVMVHLYGVAFTLLALLIVTPHVGFYIDRARQFTEHNLMPLENKDGARSFGVGMWGLAIGGGPWGQPCHWAHHLVPAIPWYQQIIVHRTLMRLLTRAQREQYTVKPIVGFPRLLVRLWREPQDLAKVLDRGDRPSI